MREAERGDRKNREREIRTEIRESLDKENQFSFFKFLTVI